jgi:hypothetical protein
MAWSRNSNWGVTTSLTQNNKNWLDPQQGEEYSCSFIAALSSILFVGKPLSIVPVSSNPSLRVFKVAFYDHTWDQAHNTWNATKNEISVNDYLPSCSTNGPLIWSKNIRNNQDIWPGIYEKAYAAFCDSINQDPVEQPSWPMCPPSKTVPHFGSALLPIHRLIPCRTCNTQANSLDCIFSPPDLSKLQAICTLKCNVTRPTVAWTGSLPPGSCPSFLKADHAYSVLGVHSSKTDPTDVVLRDPLCVAKNPNGPTGSAKWDTNLGLNTGNGIFTIKTSDFMTCMTFGYCIPSI